MKNINRSLKIFSVLMLFIFIFSVAAFAQPDDETSQPNDDEVITQTVTENTTQRTEIATSHEPETTQTAPPPSTATAVRTTAKRVNTTKRVTVTKTESRKKSDNADLSSLTVTALSDSGNEIQLTLSPNFSADEKVYNADIDFAVASVSVGAKAQSSAAKVSIPSQINLVKGSNIIQVVVTAEDGTKKTYEININYSFEETSAPVTSSTLPEITQAANIVEDSGKMNTYTKLGIVFAVGGVALLGISVYLFFKRND